MMKKKLNPETKLFVEIAQLIEQSKQQIAITVNATMSMLYWQIGKRIKNDVLLNARVDYGDQIVQSLSAQLILEYGKGWSERQLRHCVQFSSVFADEQIVSARRRQFSWTHILKEKLHKAVEIAQQKILNKNHE